MTPPAFLVLLLTSSSLPPASEAAGAAPEAAEDVLSESAELEAMKAEEARALDGEEAELTSDGWRSSLEMLGFGHPLREHLTQGLGDFEPWAQGSGSGDDPARFDLTRIQHAYDIPVEMQPEVAAYIRFFQGPGRRFYRHWLSRSTRYLTQMQRILAAEGLPRDTVYLAMIESGFSTHAYSHAHASGPWQFISATGKQFGLEQDFWVDERRDPIKSTYAAARYLRQLHTQLGHWYLAWAGYNTGGGRVRRSIAKVGASDYWQLVREKALAEETRQYVPKLLAAALLAKNYEAFGFRADEFSFEEPFEADEVELPHAVDLQVVARAAETTVEVLRELNPELKRWCTPPATEEAPYVLRVPKGSAGRFTEALAKIPASQRVNFAVHRVQPGDTLSAIAARHRTQQDAVMRMNNLKDARRLRVGTELILPVPLNAPSPLGADKASAHAPAPADTQTARARRTGAVLRPAEERTASVRPVPPVRGALKTDRVGEKLRVTYAVAAGDTLWGLSQRFDCDVEDIRRWNRLSKRARTLQVGKSLVFWPGRKFAQR